MIKDFKKEYSFLTPTHRLLLRSEVMYNFHYTTKQAFYKLIRGERKLSNSDLEFLNKRFAFYFQVQKETGRVFLEL